MNKNITIVSLSAVLALSTGNAHTADNDKKNAAIGKQWQITCKRTAKNHKDSGFDYDTDSGFNYDINSFILCCQKKKSECDKESKKESKDLDDILTCDKRLSACLNNN